MRPHIYPQLYTIAGDEADADRIQVVQNRHWRLCAIDTKLALAVMPLVDSICFGRSALGGWEEAPAPALNGMRWEERKVRKTGSLSMTRIFLHCT